MSGAAGAVLAIGCLLAVTGPGLCCAWAWLNRDALRISVANRWRPTAPLPLGALDADEGADAGTQALDRL